MLAVVAMAAAGCGSDDESTGSETETAPDTTSADSGDGGAVATTAAGSQRADNTRQTEDQGGSDIELPFESGEGTFSVDGEQTETEWVVRCAPSDEFAGNPDERDLELIAYSSEGGFLTIDVGIEDLEGMGENNYTYNTFGLDWGESVEEVSIDGLRTGPDGAWYFGVDPIQLARGAETIDPLDASPFTMEGERIVGNVDIAAIDPEQPDGVTVAFDLTIPSEVFDCSEL